MMELDAQPQRAGAIAHPLVGGIQVDRPDDPSRGVILVAASWNIAWNSVESIVGTFCDTHFRLNRSGTLKIAMH